jgi:cytoskeleton protein RodZ
MKETGQILKREREQKKITLDQVAMATKIAMKTLVAIEEGDLDNLPQKAFLRGFVRSYARYLKLDEAVVLEKFQEEMGSTNPKVKEDDLSENQDSSTQGAKITEVGEGTALLSKILLLVGGIIIVVGIIMVTNKIREYEKESQVVLPPDLGESAPAAATTTTVQTTTTQLTKTTSPPPAVPPKASPRPTPVETATVNPKPTSTPKPAPTAVASATPSPTAAPKATPKPTPKPTPAKKAVTSPQTVEVQVLDAVTLEVEIDKQPVKRIKAGVDSFHSFKGKSSVKIKISNGGAVEIFHNGKTIEPGTLGEPLTLSFPK